MNTPTALVLAVLLVVLGFIFGFSTAGTTEANVQQQVIDACVERGGVPLSDRYSDDGVITDCKFPGQTSRY